MLEMQVIIKQNLWIIFRWRIICGFPHIDTIGESNDIPTCCTISTLIWHCNWSQIGSLIVMDIRWIKSERVFQWHVLLWFHRHSLASSELRQATLNRHPHSPCITLPRLLRGKWHSRMLLHVRWRQLPSIFQRHVHLWHCLPQLATPLSVRRTTPCTQSWTYSYQDWWNTLLCHRRRWA